ncbi:uncharacterized protein MONOS_16930 [Monocercomonoides exilis]|uniref:uncharacterized protein n=1 Tax=Monocercomonoides exilis TaxID=2049356 RepID=UPI0035594595|nr:hypothetical protein MONOS_16930 [Monocercomonoides exilis]
MALLTLSSITRYQLGDELFLSKITEIIKYHQQYHNLTHLGYQSTWRIGRTGKLSELEETGETFKGNKGNAYYDEMVLHSKFIFYKVDLER